MLEYERQAEERAREQELMMDERDRMMEEQTKMRVEQERIAQEEYEMKQYYEAEALRHAEEVRLHQEGGAFLSISLNSPNEDRGNADLENKKFGGTKIGCESTSVGSAIMKLVLKHLQRLSRCLRNLAETDRFLSLHPLIGLELD